MQKGVKAEVNHREECSAVTVDEAVSKMMCQLLKQHWRRKEKKVDDPRGNLTQLIKYTIDDIKHLAKNFIQLPAEI